MKRAAWMLAIGLAVAAGFAFSMGLAQDPVESGSRYRLKPSKSKKQTLQYFSRKSPEKKTETLKKAPDAPAFPAESRVVHTEALKPRTKSDSTKTHVHPLATADAAKSPLVHAEYQKGEGTPTGGTIQQIGHGSPFETEPAKKKVRTAGFHLKPPVPEISRPLKPAAGKIRRISLSTPALMATAKIPTGAQSPTVTVEWRKDGDINVGQECVCRLVVKNSGSVEAKDVLVETNFPATVRLTGATPAPADTRGRTVWKFASLKPGQEETIEIKLIPSKRGAITAKAAVRFTGFAVSDFTVKEPLLTLAMTGAAKVNVGDAASQFIVISNPGTGVAKNVSIEAWIPKGLEHPRGKHLAMSIGSLNPGESRKVRLSLTATSGGKQAVKVKATADATGARQEQRVVEVASPSLKVAMAGPGLRYVGRSALYTITISNDGSIPTNNVRVVHKLPEGFRFVKADRGGSYDAEKRTISWFVGRVESGKKLNVQAVVAASKLGQHLHRAGAISEQAAKAEAEMTTKVEGIASLIVDISDLDDPVEVGTETAYEVRVRNTGSKAASNVQITCELPAGLELIGAKGPARAVAKQGQVVFGKLPPLAPGKAAIYRVTVRGKTAGDKRFRVRLSSDTITKSLTYDEQTRFYGE